MNFLMFAASTRKDSCNKKLIQVASKIADSIGTVDLADFREFEVPLYDADVNVAQGLPKGALDFIKRMKQNDAIILSSPEYNFSMPGTLKNLIDWVSRENPMPWMGQLILLMSASPSLVGGNRGLWNTRIPLECCGAHVFPDMFSLASAYEAFDEKGQLKDATAHARLKKTIQSFADFVTKQK